jgi:hypothetical protein
MVDLRQLLFSFYMCTECSVVCITRPKYYLHVVCWKPPPFVLYPIINFLLAYVCTGVHENILSQGTLQFLETCLVGLTRHKCQGLKSFGQQQFSTCCFFLSPPNCPGGATVTACLLCAVSCQLLLVCVSDISFLCMMTVLESSVRQSWRILW